MLAVAASLAVAGYERAPCATLHTDDFESGLSGWTSGGAIVTRQTTGGPDGAGDGFLNVQSTFRNLATYNSTSAWTGDFAAIGAVAVTADLMVPAGTTPLSIRLVLFGPGTSPATSPRWTSTVAANVPADGVWRSYAFPLAEEDLTLVLNDGEYVDVIGDNLRSMIRHDTGSPSSGGTSVDGTLGIDNVTLAGAPVLAGDYNDDGVVDAIDYAAWRHKLDEPAGALPNDVDGGPIGAAQYGTWRTNFGQERAFAAATRHTSVPETGGSALMIGGFGLVRGSRQRSR